jgi:sterol desaturase/sphingolipid hydroxylase (fatty acid hydroxylase superfamily)
MGTSIFSNEGVAVAIGVGAFLCLIGIEYGVARMRGRPVHGFADSVANLACGVVHQVANVYYSTFILPAYELLRRHWAIAPLGQPSMVSVVALFLVIDLIYYWEHRLLHASRVLWAAHVVHHQSDEFNFTVSLRVSILQVWMTTASTMLLAIVGFPPGMALVGLLVYKFYQFWTHTQLIGSLGPLEWLLVTPSHHRVHHAKNERYLDKNFGGMLIVWDRLFGTFEPECEAPSYGVAGETPVSLNPILANILPWLSLRSTVVKEDCAPASQGPVAGRVARRVEDASPPRGVSRSVVGSAILRLVAVVGLTMAMLLAESTAGVDGWLVVMPIALVWLWQLGRVLDGKQVTWRADGASAVLACSASFVLVSIGAAALVLSAALVIGAGLVMIASLGFTHRRGSPENAAAGSGALQDTHSTAWQDRESGIECR